LLIGALALVASACTGGSQVAATYDGGEITVEDVNALIPFDADTVDTTQFAQTLYRVIVDRVFTEAAEAEFSIVADEATVAESVQSIIDEVTANGTVELAEGLEANGLTEVGMEAIARQRVVFDDVRLALAEQQTAPTDEELMTEYEAQLQTLSEVCARHILLEDEVSASAALDRALEGEDFAALATELSTGPSGPDGGDLGCTSPGSFVPEFGLATMEAEIGVPYGPVQTSFGWHVILVESRTVPTFDEVRDTIQASLANLNANNLFNEWLTGKLAGAGIVVEEQYGTWTNDPAPSVLPPAP
jgi:peptidyl-prolyl cis-trans isomerase C